MLRKRISRVVGVVITVAVLGTLVRSDAPRLSLQEPRVRRGSPIVEPFLIDLQERTFRFFWDTANPRNGLVPDRYPTTSFSSVASVGFALTTYPVGVERKYVTRSDARKRVLATLRFLRDAPQGPDPRGVAGYAASFITSST